MPQSGALELWPNLSLSSPRSLYLALIGAVYVCAFGSYWLQFPGIYGSDGLVPVETHWKRIARSGSSYASIPSVLWFKGGAPVDVVMEGTALVGLACGAAALAGVHHASIFALAFLCYLSLFVLGPTFLSFQWDIFILETGAATILYAPWWSVSAPRPLPAVAWLLRVLWVKFMVMNGIVKVRADCPTWRDLTALEFHFASTCLPTAEAWFFHSLPPFLLRCGVAAMFMAELVAPWLLLVPIRTVRRFGVAAQLPLQLGIALSGNYNWFNLHTAVLLLPAWDADVDDVEREREEEAAEGEHREAGGKGLWRSLSPRRCALRWERSCATPLARRVAAVAVLSVLLMAWRALFSITWSDRSAGISGALWDPAALRITSKVTKRVARDLLKHALSRGALLALYAVVAAAGLTHALAPMSRRAGGGTTAASLQRVLRFVWRLTIGIAALLALGVTLFPLREFVGGTALPLPAPFHATTAELIGVLSPFRVTSSYGLFRSMTGVGRPYGAGPQWGGVPSTAVAIPAVVVELSWDDGATWEELPFRYAPYKTRAPRRTAPHQPRLDWQMWFAALSRDYSSNPWFLRLIHALLRGGSDDVVALLDTDAMPRLADTNDPPTTARASLYHLDFTRATVASAWVERIPGDLARVVAANSNASAAWWSRRRVREFLPAVDKAALEDVARAQGWPRSAPKRGAHFFAAKQCRGLRGMRRAACSGVVRARALGAPLRAWNGITIGDARGDGSHYWSCYFIDGPMLALAAAIAAPLALAALLRRCCCCCCCCSTREAKRAPRRGLLLEEKKDN